MDHGHISFILFEIFFDFLTKRLNVFEHRRMVIVEWVMTAPIFELFLIISSVFFGAQIVNPIVVTMFLIKEILDIVIIVPEKKNFFSWNWFINTIFDFSRVFETICPKKKKPKIKACFSYLYMDSNFSAGYPMAIIRSHIYVRSKSYFLFEISSTCLCLFLDTMVFKADAIFILQKKGSFGQIF